MAAVQQMAPLVLLKRNQLIQKQKCNVMEKNIVPLSTVDFEGCGELMSSMERRFIYFLFFKEQLQTVFLYQCLSVQGELNASHILFL